MPFDPTSRDLQNYSGGKPCAVNTAPLNDHTGHPQLKSISLGGAPAPSTPDFWTMPDTASAPVKRKSGSETRQRRASIPVRYSDEERAEVHRRAERAGLTVSAYVRVQTLEIAGPRSQRRPAVEAQLLAKLLGQIGRIGNNVNQIAHAANAGEPPRGSRLAEAFDDIARMRAAVMEALGRNP